MSVHEEYRQVRKDWETLWSIGPAEDMTGGYVDAHDLHALMMTPTKKTAIRCFISQIKYWFQKGILEEELKLHGFRTMERLIDHREDVQEIASRYGIEL